MTHQAVVAAIQGLKREHPLDPAAITRVVIHGAPRIMEERHTEREPHDVLGGQYSLPFTTAVALTRDLSDPLVYDDAAVHDPLVRDLARRNRARPGPGRRARRPRRVARRGAGGVRGQAARDRDAPVQGLDAESLHVGRRVREVPALHALGAVAPRAEAIIEAIGGLGAQADVAEIARHLVASS